MLDEEQEFRARARAALRRSPARSHVTRTEQRSPILRSSLDSLNCTTRCSRLANPTVAAVSCSPGTPSAAAALPCFRRLICGPTSTPPSRPRNSRLDNHEMATLERPQAVDSYQQDTQMNDFEPAAVPTPFPDRQPAASGEVAEPARGRSAAPAPSHRALAGTGQHATSQSPGGSTRSLSRAVVDRVKRAMSASRDRQAESSERGRRLSDTSGAHSHLNRLLETRDSIGRDADLQHFPPAGQQSAEDQPRGRSPLSAFRPRSLSRGPSATGQQAFQTVSELDVNDDRTLASGSYPLSKSATRSSSRGRAPVGGKIFSTGRGGAGNLIGIAAGEDMSEFDGEEDPRVLEAVREDRSRSRERDGYIEVTASGRGGRGNIRSQSRGRDLELGRVPTVMEEQERMDIEDEELRMQEILRKRERDGPDQWVSTGRGEFITWNGLSLRRRRCSSLFLPLACIRRRWQLFQLVASKLVRSATKPNCSVTLIPPPGPHLRFSSPLSPLLLRSRCACRKLSCSRYKRCRPMSSSLQDSRNRRVVHGFLKTVILHL